MKIRIIAPLAFASLIALACGSTTGDPTAPVNLPPSIVFHYVPLGVEKGTTVDLGVTVADPNPGDKLSLHWTVTRGVIMSRTPDGTSVRWQAPVITGIDTVTVGVTDGSLTTQIVEELHVGTRVALDQFDGTWVAAQSPYILVPPSDRMTVLTSAAVEPGVEFLFDVPGGGIQVEGTLDSRGNARRPVIFRPNDRTLRCQSGRGWWSGITVRGATGTARLSHTEIWYGNKNIDLIDSGSATLVGCELRCGSLAGVQMSSAGFLVVDSCNVDNNKQTGIAVQSLSNLPDSVRITNSYIGINGNSGVLLDLRDSTQTVPIRIEYNKIEFNFVHGVYVQNQVFPSIHQNHFASNGLNGALSNLWLQSPYPSPAVLDTLDATNNYWGSVFTSVAGIDLTIHDRLDDRSIGTRVLATPWLNTSPVD